MIEVTSSAIAAVGHDGRARMLLVRFRSGETYAYRGAPPELFGEFLSAPSKGRFFHARIDGRLPYARLES